MTNLAWLIVACGAPMEMGSGDGYHAEGKAEEVFVKCDQFETLHAQPADRVELVLNIYEHNYVFASEEFEAYFVETLHNLTPTFDNEGLGPEYDSLSQQDLVELFIFHVYEMETLWGPDDADQEAIAGLWGKIRKIFRKILPKKRAKPPTPKPVTPDIPDMPDGKDAAKCEKWADLHPEVADCYFNPPPGGTALCDNLHKWYYGLCMGYCWAGLPLPGR